jgi:hypothetical protein
MSKYWNRMSELMDTIEYLNRLGFGCARQYRTAGWIVDAQRRLVDIETRIAKSVGGYPLDVHYNRQLRCFVVRKDDKTERVELP